MNTRNKIIAAVIALGLILIAIFKVGLGGRNIPVVNNKRAEESQSPAIISSDPPQLYIKEPLVVSPNQVFKLNFNVSLMNGPETKIGISPEHEIQVDVENDNKTVVIKPKTPYKLGQGYTISVKDEAKLREEGKNLGRSYDFHFNVINYSGI